MVTTSISLFPIFYNYMIIFCFKTPALPNNSIEYIVGIQNHLSSTYWSCFTRRYLCSNNNRRNQVDWRFECDCVTSVCPECAGDRWSSSFTGQKIFPISLFLNIWKMSVFLKFYIDLYQIGQIDSRVSPCKIWNAISDSSEGGHRGQQQSLASVHSGCVPVLRGWERRCGTATPDDRLSHRAGRWWRRQRQSHLPHHLR